MYGTPLLLCIHMPLHFWNISTIFPESEVQFPFPFSWGMISEPGQVKMVYFKSGNFTSPCWQCHMYSMWDCNCVSKGKVWQIWGMSWSMFQSPLVPFEEKPMWECLYGRSYVGRNCKPIHVCNCSTCEGGCCTSVIPPQEWNLLWICLHLSCCGKVSLSKNGFSCQTVHPFGN